MYSGEFDSDTLNQPNIPELSTISISGEKYIANLVWTPSASAHEAEVSRNELCFQLNSGNYCRYKPNKYLIQFGVVAAGDNSCHGLPALAANIKSLEDASFCGIWTTDERLWVILAFDDDQGVLVDAVFDSKEEARLELERAIIQHDYKSIYVPDDSWVGFNSENPYPELADLLKAKSKCIVTNAKKRKIKNLLFIVGVAALATAIFFAFNYWQEKQQEARDEAAEAERLANRPKIHIAPPPWLDKPSQNGFVSKCVDELTKHDLDTTLIAGWSEDTNTQRVCSTSGVEYTIKRDGATENWYDFMREHINIAHKPEMVKLSANSVKLKWPVEFSKEQIDQTMYSYSNVVAYLQSQFAEMGRTGITFDAANTQSGYSGWQAYTFKFSLGDNPYLYLPLLNKINNLIFIQMNYLKSNNSWDVQGVLYEKLPQQSPR